MKNFVKKSGALLALSVTASLGLGSVAYSYDFSAADAEFAKRGAGWDQAEKAAALYKTAMDSGLSRDEKIYTELQYFRLKIYQSGMLESEPKAKRLQAAKDCFMFAKKLDKTYGQAYFYPLLACAGTAGKLVETLEERIVWAGELNTNLRNALQSTTVGGKLVGGLEGGGVLRVLSGVYGNRKADSVGLFKPALAVQYSQLAVDAPEGDMKPFGKIKGEDMLDNHFYLAQSLVAQGVDESKADALIATRARIAATLASYADKKANGKWPVGRDPEDRYYAASLATLRAKMNACSKVDEGAPASKWDAGWNQCLIKATQE